MLVLGADLNLYRLVPNLDDYVNGAIAVTGSGAPVIDGRSSEQIHQQPNEHLLLAEVGSDDTQARDVLDLRQANALTPQFLGNRDGRLGFAASTLSFSRIAAAAVSYAKRNDRR